MEIDAVKQMYLINVKDGVHLFKFDIFPSRDIKKRMCVGTLALGKEEAMKVYNFLRCYFEGSPLPPDVTQINIAGKPRKQVPAEFRPPNTADLMDAEALQKENEGDVEPTPKKPPIVRGEGLTLEEASQM